MTAKFSSMEDDKSFQNDSKTNIMRLTGQAGDISTHAVLKKEFVLPQITGVDTDDIAAIHSTLMKLLNYIKGT